MLACCLEKGGRLVRKGEPWPRCSSAVGNCGKECIKLRLLAADRIHAFIQRTDCEHSPVKHRHRKQNGEDTGKTPGKGYKEAPGGVLLSEWRAGQNAQEDENSLIQI